MVGSYSLYWVDGVELSFILSQQLCLLPIESQKANNVRKRSCVCCITYLVRSMNFIGHTTKARMQKEEETKADWTAERRSYLQNVSQDPIE